MLLYLDALSSSAIEGTKANIKEVFEENKDKKSGDDSIKIINLYKTTYEYYHDTDFLNSNITSIESIERINRALFKNISGDEKYAGIVRDFQNYIGGDSVYDALFVPPPPEKVRPLLQDLDNFWNNDELFLPDLIKIAIYHYQFETIHPFKDGNGRTGRTLINLQMKKLGLLRIPVLCLSDYWRKNKGMYYNALSTARFSGDIEYWVKFFLQSIINAASERFGTINHIMGINDKYTQLIKERFKTHENHMKLCKHLLAKKPFVTVKDVQDLLQISYQGASNIVNSFVKLDILSLNKDSKRNRAYVFDEYYDLVFKDFVKQTCIDQ
jgi:Fic family protein